MGLESGINTQIRAHRQQPGATDSFTIAATSNRMTAIANLAIGYGFDAAGNRTTTPTITHTYNARGRMTRSVVVNGATSQTFNYLVNALEQRVRKTGPSSVVPSGTKIFVYDDGGQLIGEYDNLGRARKEYIWLPDHQGNGPTWRPVAMVTYTYSGTGTTPISHAFFAIEADHLGAPRRVGSTTNQTRWTWNPAPFGDTLPNENPSGLGVFTLNLRFPGQYFDKETNLAYNHHRDHEATSGRYVQSDPIGLGGGVNTYLYAMAVPTKYSDPKGLETAPKSPRPGVPDCLQWPDMPKSCGAPCARECIQLAYDVVKACLQSCRTWYQSGHPVGAVGLAAFCNTQRGYFTRECNDHCIYNVPQ